MLCRWAFAAAVAFAAPLPPHSHRAPTPSSFPTAWPRSRARSTTRELLKLPADLREGFGNNPRRVTRAPARMLVQKSLAAQARAAKARPASRHQARGSSSKSSNSCRTMQIEAIDAAAVAEFDANIAKYEARARELYLVDKAAFTSPPQITATHILFDTKKHGAEEARKLADRDARQDRSPVPTCGKLAREISDDPSSVAERGHAGLVLAEGHGPVLWRRRLRARAMSATCPSPCNRSSDGTSSGSTAAGRDRRSRSKKRATRSSANSQARDRGKAGRRR